MKSHQRVLMVGEEGVILYAPAEKGIGRKASIPWTAKDFRRQMTAALEHRHDPVVVLFNEADHTYRKEENLHPSQKQERMDRFFPQVKTRAALEIPGTDSKLRNYLFVALPDSEKYSRLGGALANTEIAGCAVLPVESTSLVSRLSRKVFPKGKRSRWAILAGQHETGGMRHVCIRDGVLALTRMIPLDDADRNAWAKAATQELEATMDYLRRFGFEDGHGMDVMMICGKGEKKLFGKKSVPGARFRSLTLQEALEYLGYKVSGQDGDHHFADALYAAWAEHSEIKLLLPVTAIERP